MKSQPPPPDKEWDVDEFLIYITNEKNWKNGKPVWKGIMFPTLLNAISYFIRSLILSKDQEADRRIEEVIRIVDDYFATKRFASTDIRTNEALQFQLRVIYNELKKKLSPQKGGKGGK